METQVHAGHKVRSSIVAVLRPASFVSSSPAERVDQKRIIKEDVDMSMQVKHMPEGKEIQRCPSIFF